MKNKVVAAIIAIFVLSCNVVYARHFPAKESLDTILDCLGSGDSEIYHYIDNTNIELKENIEQYLGKVDISYEFKDIEEDGEHSVVEVKIFAQGKNWSVSGFNIDFEFDRINNEYILTGTTLFEHIGPENILKCGMKIFAIILGVMMFVSISIVITVLLIIKTNRKK